jgi:hypothetical protein
VRRGGTLMVRAAASGLTHAALSRPLAVLAREGASARAPGSITLRRPPAL